MTYGLAVPGYRGIRSLVEEVHDNPANYSTMASIISRAQEVCLDAYQQFIEEARQPDGSLPLGLDQAEVGYIIGGFDGNDTAQFRIYECSSGGGFQFREQLGSNLMAAQWHLADWLFPFLDYPGMSVSHGLRVAVTLMIIVSTFEQTVGGPIHVATVTIDQGFSLLHEREVARIVEDVQPTLIALRTAWQYAWQA